MEKESKSRKIDPKEKMPHLNLVDSPSSPCITSFEGTVHSRAKKAWKTTVLFEKQEVILHSQQGGGEVGNSICCFFSYHTVY